MSSGATAQDSTWKSKEQGEEGRYARQKEQEQLAELRSKLGADEATERAAAANPSATNTTTTRNRDEFEGGYGGQEDLEDRYATTSGEH